MIYKCKNCGREYSCFVEYCDCGNNKFLCVSDDENFSEQSDYLTPNDDFENSVYDFENINRLSNNNSFLNCKNFQNAVMIVLILFTIVFSIFILYKAINSNNSFKNNKVNEVKTSIEVPSIEQFWDNSIEQDFSDINTKSNKISKNQSLNISPKTKSIDKNASIIRNNTNSVVKNVASNDKRKNLVQNSSKLKNTENDNTKKIKKDTLKNSTNKIDDEVVNQNKQVDNTNSVLELDRYKVNIRHLLFSKFPVLLVKGDGVAIIAFSVDKNGKLLNRRFIQQSENKSLDDAIYHMLMQTPFVSSPPNSYLGEDFKIRIDFNNGQYSFSYQ